MSEQKKKHVYHFFSKEKFETHEHENDEQALVSAQDKEEVVKVVAADGSRQIFPSAIAVLFLLLALTLPAKAQVFGGGVTISGTTNSAPQGTNSFSLTIPQKSLTLSGVSNTNEVFVGSVAIVILGTTNVVPVSSLTNSFLSGTNGGTWSTNFGGTAIPISYYWVYQASIGSTNTNSIYVP